MVRHLFNVRRILMYHDAPCVPNYDGHLLYNDCTVSQLCDAPFLDFDEPWLSEWRTSVNKTRQLNFPTSQSNKSMQTWKSIASSLTVTRSFSFFSWSYRSPCTLLLNSLILLDRIGIELYHIPVYRHKNTDIPVFFAANKAQSKLTEIVLCRYSFDPRDPNGITISYAKQWRSMRQPNNNTTDEILSAGSITR